MLSTFSLACADPYLFETGFLSWDLAADSQSVFIFYISQFYAKNWRFSEKPKLTFAQFISVLSKKRHAYFSPIILAKIFKEL
jgi:hypothetical protein